MERELFEKMIVYMIQCVLSKNEFEMVGVPGDPDICPHLVLKKNNKLHFMILTLEEAAAQKAELLLCAENFHAVPCIVYLKQGDVEKSLFGLQMTRLEFVKSHRSGCTSSSKKLGI